MSVLDFLVEKTVTSSGLHNFSNTYSDSEHCNNYINKNAWKHCVGPHLSLFVLDTILAQ